MATADSLKADAVRVPGATGPQLRRRAAALSPNKKDPDAPQSTRAAGAGGSSSTMMKLYTQDENPGLKVEIPMSRQRCVEGASRELSHLSGDQTRQAHRETIGNHGTDFSTSLLPSALCSTIKSHCILGFGMIIFYLSRQTPWYEQFEPLSDPVIVLSLAVVFIFSVVFLHLFTKVIRYFSK